MRLFNIINYNPLSQIFAWQQDISLFYRVIRTHELTMRLRTFDGVRIWLVMMIEKFNNELIRPIVKQSI